MIEGDVEFLELKSPRKADDRHTKAFREHVQLYSLARFTCFLLCLLFLSFIRACNTTQLERNTTNNNS